MYPTFVDRHDAGKRLAERLRQYTKSCIVLALPRGGVVVGYEVAKALHARLDILVVRKLGVPWQKELGIGAVSEDGSMFVDHEASMRLGIGEGIIASIKEEEEKEMKRRIQVYRKGKPLPKLSRKKVILVDDGVATGVTMLAAIQTAKQHHAKVLIAAAPVCSKETAEEIRQEVDSFVCLHEVWDMQSIGMYYENFWQVEDEEVGTLLEKNKIENKQKKRRAHSKSPNHLVAM